jgi:hypothetical protein
MTNQQELDGIWNNICGASQLAFIDLICQRLLDTPTDKQGGGTTTLRTELSWLGRNFQNVPGTVWNATVSGGSTAAGVLNHIDAKPAIVSAGPGAPAAPAAVDVDALVARLKAELPAATLAALAGKLA